MNIILIGFGKINQIVYKNNTSDIVGIVDVDKKFIYQKPDIIIDFSHPNMLDKVIKYASFYKVPVLIGTTGYNEEKMAQIKELSLIVPVLISSNFSQGIAIISKVLKDNILYLNKYEKKIVEIHQKDKSDKISGTAIMLANLIKTDNVFAERIETSAGEHRIKFSSEFEEIEISHIAKNRNVFVLGAMKAASWLVNQPAGLYSFEDTFYEQV